jgi:transposase InsO family protein
MKNFINLDHYYLPGELERDIDEFVNYYNNERYHEALNNLKPVGVYNGKSYEILDRREEIKQRTMHMRRH